MDSSKFNASVQRYRQSLEEAQSVRRLTQRLPDNVVERPIAQGKRMRLSIGNPEDGGSQGASQATNTSGQKQRPMHPPIHTPGPRNQTETPVVIYPNKKGGVALFQGDLERLREGVYLDDRIVNVLLSWAYTHYVAPSQKPYVQLCDSYMFEQLSRGVEMCEVVGMTPTLVRNFERVKGYRSSKGPGDKALTVMPICEHQHWYLLFITVERAEFENRVSVLIADSFANAPRTHVVRVVQLYLESTLPGRTITQTLDLGVAQQGNGYDCGLHVIQNAIRGMQYLSPRVDVSIDELTAALNLPPGPISRAAVHAILNQLSTGKDTAPEDAAVDVPAVSQTNSVYHAPVNTAEEPLTDMLCTPTPPIEAILELFPRQILALDGRTVIGNQLDEVWSIDDPQMCELIELVEGARAGLEQKQQRRIKFLRETSTSLLSVRSQRHGGFTRIIRIGQRKVE